MTTTFHPGDRVTFIGATAVMIVESMPNPDTAKVYFVCDHLRKVPMDYSVNLLKPANPSTEDSNARTYH